MDSVKGFCGDFKAVCQVLVSDGRNCPQSSGKLKRRDWKCPMLIRPCNFWRDFSVQTDKGQEFVGACIFVKADRKIKAALRAC